MAWHKGYFYRSVREGDRVRRIYVGKGAAAQQAARELEQRKAERQARQEKRRLKRQEITTLHELVHQACQHTQVLMEASLVAAGFRQYFGSDWHRRKPRKKP